MPMEVPRKAMPMKRAGVQDELLEGEIPAEAEGAREAQADPPPVRDASPPR
jgi:hypothetical protein